MSEQSAPTDSKLKSLSWFFVASLTAAVLNYLFHVVVARRIGAEAFGHFSVEWSYLSLYFIGGAVATYFAALNPIRLSTKRMLMSSLHVAGAVMLGFNLLDPALALVNLAQGLLLGICLGRKDYARVSILNVALALIRIVMAVVLPRALLDVRGIFIMVYFSIVAVQLLYFLFVRPKQIQEVEAKPVAWLAPVLLAVVAGVIPQIDILWCANFPGGEAILKISELALVSKGVFFLQLIVSQWMLPLEQKRTPTLKHVAAVLLGAAVFSAVAGLAAVYILPVVLQWTTPVTALDFIRISLIGMSSSVFYVLIQMLCKTGRSAVPMAAITLLLGQALAQGFAGLSLDSYLTITTLVYIILALGLAAYQATRSRAAA